MNRELYLCSLLMLAVFAGMIWYLADYVSSNQEALFNNSYNSQQRVLAQENTRGTIYAGTGEVLAQTVIAEDGTSVREYPYKNIFAHVVGYTDKGKTGIEELENYQLIHSDISDREKLDHELAGEKNPGNDVYTTLDTSLQQAASDALGLYRGAIVVTEVKTGRVLAMVSVTLRIHRMSRMRKRQLIIALVIRSTPFCRPRLQIKKLSRTTRTIQNVM